MTVSKASARTKSQTKSTSRSSGRNGSDPAMVDAKTVPIPRGRSSNGTQPTNQLSKPEPLTSAASSLSELINQTLARTREADPHVIARQLLPKLAPEALGELALAGLAERIAKHIAQVRRGGVAVPQRTVGESKWKIAQRVWVAGEHKLLADCNCADLEALAEQHRDIAARNLSRAEEYKQLAAALRTSGCATVGELWARKDLAA